MTLRFPRKSKAPQGCAVLQGQWSLKQQRRGLGLSNFTCRYTVQHCSGKELFKKKILPLFRKKRYSWTKKEVTVPDVMIFIGLSKGRLGTRTSP